MYPIDRYETIRRGHEELLRRAEYERMARKARIKQGIHRSIKAASWLRKLLVSWGAKLKKFVPFAKRQPAPTTTTRVRIHQLSKMSPHH